MTTTPDQPTDDDRAEAAIDELARRSAGAVRRPPPTGAMESVITAGTRKRRIQTAGVIGGVAVLVIATVAFTRGGDNDDTVTVDTSPQVSTTTAGPAPAAVTTTTEAPTTTVAADDALQWALDFTGGPGGLASGDPVRIGLAGIEPTISRATVDLINTQLGGVQGRPVELVECQWTDTAAAVACGQQLAADPTISVVISPVDPSEFLTALGDVPRFGGFMVGGGAGISYGGSFRSQMNALAQLIPAQWPDANKIAIVGPNDIGALLSRPDVEVVSALSDVSSGSSVFDAVRAVDAEDADVFLTVQSTTDCSGLAEALGQLGSTAPVVADMCTNPEDGWFYVDVPFNPDDPSEQWGAKFAIDLLERQGLDLVTADDSMGFRSGEFSDLMNAVKILNGLGATPTRTEIAAALEGFTGPAALSGPQDCSFQQLTSPLPFGCARFVQVLTAKDGKFVSVDPIEVKPDL